MFLLCHVDMACGPGNLVDKLLSLDIHYAWHWSILHLCSIQSRIPEPKHAKGRCIYCVDHQNTIHVCLCVYHPKEDNHVLSVCIELRLKAPGELWAFIPILKSHRQLLGVYWVLPKLSDVISLIFDTRWKLARWRFHSLGFTKSILITLLGCLIMQGIFSHPVVSNEVSKHVVILFVVRQNPYTIGD